MKTDINTILKHGNRTRIEAIDYSTPEKIAELKELKKRSEIALSNKFVSQFKLSEFIIRK